MAGEAGVGRQWLSKFESGDGTVELGMALKVVAALGLEVRLFSPREVPEWSKPLTASAGTRARPYGRARRPRKAMMMEEG